MTLVYHQVAELFPLIEGDEFAALVDDIKRHGLIEPIWLHPDGSIIDGRNRYLACVEAGVEPKTRTWLAEGSLIEFVLSVNLHRRHLDESQRAMIAARSKPLFAEEARKRQGARTDLRANLPERAHGDTRSDHGRARDKAAEMAHVSPRSVESASKVLAEGAPELVRAVDSGLVAVSNAAAISELSKTEQVAVICRGEKEIIAVAKEIKERRTQEGRRTRVDAKAAEVIPEAGDHRGVTTDQDVIHSAAVILDDPIHAAERIRAQPAQWVAKFTAALGVIPAANGTSSADAAGDKVNSCTAERVAEKMIEVLLPDKTGNLSISFNYAGEWTVSPDSPVAVERMPYGRVEGSATAAVAQLKSGAVLTYVRIPKMRNRKRDSFLIVIHGDAKNIEANDLKYVLGAGMTRLLRDLKNPTSPNFVAKPKVGAMPENSTAQVADDVPHDVPTRTADRGNVGSIPERPMESEHAKSHPGGSAQRTL